ncbi:MAG: protein-glutamate O-methyltransferase CheR [Chloroflexi bacterium]|nr:protein-glutamate O-methyltransferase CheR [Chloroflexota bacterium]
MVSVAMGGDTIALDSLLGKVYRDTGYDFREYKRGTVTRRLERRLHTTGVRTYLDYIEFIGAHPEEYHKLANDLIIKVSGFFRSPYTFQQVARLVLPGLTSFKRNRGERKLRFWSAGCARGEEPYSIAILLAEFLGNRRQDFNISIYATDISRQALQEAQAGVYSAKDIEGLTPAVLENYFTRYDKGYVVNSNIRQMVSFSHFDLTSTIIRQPFVGVDCIFCCNVLIYLQSQLQERVLSMLYDSLATPGYLILGEVETLTNSLSEKLERLDARAKIYKKSEGRR